MANWYNGIYNAGSVELFNVVNETTSHTVNGASVRSYQWREAQFHLYCSSLTGTSDTLDVKIQVQDPTTEQWTDIATFAQLIAAGSATLVVTAALGSLIRPVYTTGGTVTDCDFKLGVVWKG
ncbi:MAG: hypothetical protein ACNYVW_04280 [Methanosarcinales archaeon]